MKKINAELDELVEHLRPAVADAFVSFLCLLDSTDPFSALLNKTLLPSGSTIFLNVAKCSSLFFRC